jgi:hypothetical protein
MARAAEGAEHIKEILGDDNFVIEEILEPYVILAVCEGDEREQIAEIDADGRPLSFGEFRTGRVHTQKGGHSADPPGHKGVRSRLLVLLHRQGRAANLDHSRENDPSERWRALCRWIIMHSQEVMSDE